MVVERGVDVIPTDFGNNIAFVVGIGITHNKHILVGVVFCIAIEVFRHTVAIDQRREISCLFARRKVEHLKMGIFAVNSYEECHLRLVVVNIVEVIPVVHHCLDGLHPLRLVVVDMKRVEVAVGA